MKPLTFDGLRALLPELDELRPLVDHALARSHADPARTWSGSGALGTAGARLVDAAELEAAVADIARREHEHRRRTYEVVARALALLSQGDTTGAAERLMEAAEVEEERNEAARAEAYADAATRLARDGRDPRLTSLALRRRARHRRASGRYREAEADYDEAVVVARAVDDHRGAAEALIGAGNVLEEEGRWKEAEARYRQALDVLDAAGGEASERWHALLNLHVVLRSVGSLDDCVEPLERAEAVAERMGELAAARFAIENHRGQLRMAHGDFQGAEEHLRQAVAESRTARAEITIRLNLAETLLAMGRALESAEEIRRAERRAIIACVPQKLPEVYRLLGRLAASEGGRDAFVLFERALEIIAERGLPALERAQTLQAYAEVEARMGDDERSAGLLAEADRIYRELGLDRRRRTWVDRFDEHVAPAEPNLEETEDEDDE